MEDFDKKIRQDCWDSALDAFGFSYIFANKKSKIDNWLRLSKVFGILVPVILGGLVGSYYANETIMGAALWIAAPLAIAQLILSTVLTTIGSDEQATKFAELSIEYALINSEFEQMAKFPNLQGKENFESNYLILKERMKNISRKSPEVSDKEKRKGMRYGLRNYKRPCAGCNETPLSMDSTNCHVCGKF